MAAPGNCRRNPGRGVGGLQTSIALVSCQLKGLLVDDDHVVPRAGEQRSQLSSCLTFSTAGETADEHQWHHRRPYTDLQAGRDFHLYSA